MIAFILSPIGRGLISVGIVVGAFLVWLATHDQKVEQRVVTKIEKATENATKLGTTAAAGSADKRVRGRRDPTTRDD